MCLFRLLNSTRKPTGLLSPGRQIPFLVSLQLSTALPQSASEFTNEDWIQSVGRLNDIFTMYEEFFWPTPEELGSRDRSTHAQHGVAFKAFLHYFNNPLLASVEQIERRIRNNCVPFDAEIADLLGLSASEGLEICQWISAQLQSGWDEFASAMAAAFGPELRGNPAFDVQSALRRVLDSNREPFQLRISTALETVGKVRLDDIRARFGTSGAAYLDAFEIGRGNGPALTFPTDPYVLDRRPLVTVDVATGMCLAGNALFNALLNVFETSLLESTHRSAFLRRRDAVLESETANALQRITGTRVMQSVFEQPNSTFEHDLIAVIDDTVIIGESKATPPTEPFRDPDRSFRRLQRAFRSDTGIQKAFDQAMRLRRLLLTNDTVALFSEQGIKLCALKCPSEVFAICVTRDSFGPLATDLSVLLDRPADEPFPWVASVLDLDQIAEAWDYMGWGAPEFLRYLRQRIRLHGRVFGSDELEYVGFFIRHGSLGALLEQGDAYINLEPSYSDFFDQLYLFRRGAGPAPSKQPRPPVIRELTAEPANTVPPQPPLSPVFYRRRPCPCGSGKRYKNCHGRK